MKRTIRDLKNITGKRVLVRCDFNVPLDKYGYIKDDTRIVEALPTIQYLVEKNAKVILCSHLGRPKGFDKWLSLFPVAVYLMRKFPNRVRFCDRTVGPDVMAEISKMKKGQILVLENTRFVPGEEANSEGFASQLASLADLYVDDAFGSAHRKHASNYGVALKLPNAIGFLMEKELKVFDELFHETKHPFVAVVGGAKVEDKLKLIQNFIGKADTIIIGGAMAYTFLLAQGYNVGDSPVVMNQVQQAMKLLNTAKEKGVKVLLPVDHIVMKKGKDSVFDTKTLSRGMVGYDIGKKSIKLFSDAILKAKTVVWNGPVGKYEDKRFARGTTEIAKAIAKSKAYSVVGGGDSVSAVRDCGVAKKISHISTGGGASLQLMSGKTLPAVEIIGDV